MGKHLKEKNKKAKRAVENTAPNKIREDEDKFNFNNEIVIGISMPANKKTNEKQRKNSGQPVNKKKLTKKKIKKKGNKKKSAIIKLIIILALIISGIIFILVSPEFNVQNINVMGNEHLKTQEIINLSNIQKDENIYSFSKNNVIENIKKNAYIDQVYLKRKLPNSVEIIVKERKTAFNVKYENSYIYINNKGYILENVSEKTENPTIIGISTSKESLNPGMRLCEEDLYKLSDILKILDVMKNNDLLSLVTEINIKDKQNYILILQSEGKTVHIGDISNLETKVLFIKDILEREKGINGEIFVNRDLNTENVFFRESV